MVRRDGYEKVLDFGLAKKMSPSGAIPNGETATNLSLPGQVLGTVAYMSPEQIQQQEIDGRTDLSRLDYSLRNAYRRTSVALQISRGYIARDSS